jgi:hypothetical protein
MCDDSLPETIQSTSRITVTVEPTTGVSDGDWYVHPQTGVVIPLKNIVIKGGGRLGLIVTAAVSVNASAYLECEE